MNPNRLLTVAGLTFLLSFSGCATTKKATDARKLKTGSDFGYFNGPIETRWDDDGLNMTVLKELRYTDPDGVVWVAPTGAKVNGASVPRAFWSLIGGPFDGKYRKASVLHDVAYDEKSRPWQEVDRMFYNAMRCAGVGPAEAKTMYYSVYRFGHHWKFKSKRARAVAGGSVSGSETRPSAVNPSDVNAIENWIEQSNPGLNEIEARASDDER